MEGGGRVPLKLEGADFEFIEKVELQKAGAHTAPPLAMPFTLPLGKRGGYQQSMEAELNPAGLAPGQYRVILAQSDGVPHEIPVTVLPPNPKIDNLPLLVNLGETQQKLSLRGSGLDRVEKITTDAGEIDLAALPAKSDAREAIFKLVGKAEGNIPASPCRARIIGPGTLPLNVQ